MCSGSTKAQKAAQQAQTDYTNQLMQIMKEEFAQNQGVLNFLIPQLRAMASAPEGFGATEYKNLQSQLINNVGAQFSNAQKAANEQFAISNEAGLPSGVQQQVNAQIGAAAAGAEAGGLETLSIQNEQLKNEQREFALSGLTGIGSTTGGQAISAGGTGAGSASQQFNEATQLYNQGNQWQGILGGLVGTGLGFATGGLTNILGGGSFFKPAAPGGGGMNAAPGMNAASIG